MSLNSDDESNENNSEEELTEDSSSQVNNINETLSNSGSEKQSAIESLLNPLGSLINFEKNDNIPNQAETNPSNNNSDDIFSSSNFDEDKNSNSNIGISKQGKKNLSNKAAPLTNSKNIITIDSERPPSGYSSYSYSYEYSDSDDNKSTKPSQKKAHKKEKTEKEYSKYVPPIVNLPQDELDALKRRALNFEPLEDLEDDVYEALIVSLAKDRVVSAKNQDLKQSELLNDAISYVTQSQLEQRKFALQQGEYNKYRTQMISLQSELQVFDSETAAKEKKLNDDIDTQRKRLIQEHEHQIETLQKKWSSENKIKQYNHASPRLLFLRKQYRQLIQQCRFNEATEVKKQISVMEKKEEAEAMKVMQQDFDESLNNTLKKQSEELQFFEIKSVMQRNKLKKEREKLRQPISNKENKLKLMEQKMNDPDKLWNRAQMKRSMDVSQGKMRDAKISPKIAAKELDQVEDTTIKLPKLNFKRKTFKSTL